MHWFTLYTKEVRVMFNFLARLCSMEEILFKRHETDMGCLVYTGLAPAAFHQWKQCEAGLSYTLNTIGYCSTNDFGQSLMILSSIRA